MARQNDYVDQLKIKVSELVKVVQQNNGTMNIEDAHRMTAKYLGDTVTAMPYVGSCAVADGLLTRSLRQGTYSLP